MTKLLLTQGMLECPFPQTMLCNVTVDILCGIDVQQPDVQHHIQVLVLGLKLYLYPPLCWNCQEPACLATTSLTWSPGGGGVPLVWKRVLTVVRPLRWLSRPATTKKGGLSFYHIVGQGGCQRQFN